MGFDSGQTVTKFVTVWAITVSQEGRHHRITWYHVPTRNSSTTAGLGSYVSSGAEPTLEVLKPRKFFEILPKRSLPTQGE